MATVFRILFSKTSEHLCRARDRVAAFSRPAAVARLTVYRHVKVDTSAVTHLKLKTIAIHDGDVSPHSFGLNDVSDRVNLARLARNATDEYKTSPKRGISVDHSAQRMQHCSQSAFLLTCTPSAHDLPGKSKRSAVYNISAIRIRHRIRRLVHGVGHKHQRRRCALSHLNDQVSHHVVAKLGTLQNPPQLRFDRDFYKMPQRRFCFQQLGLRTRHPQ